MGLVVDVPILLFFSLLTFCFFLSLNIECECRKCICETAYLARMRIYIIRTTRMGALVTIRPIALPGRGGGGAANIYIFPHCLKKWSF